ncbi:uncharacterized protein A4U43_C05F18220 [Asparagus officinalis]|uniref:NAD-dependent epimerase/dehydratase domain-containing protein n=1 Tax=Asparagus officinalis TaxID=4686 RepID=A0A5P1EWD7_ASPOF|nr:uncharacterized protein A4U43_C05F18220 [Asparagus officinalis]
MAMSQPLMGAGGKSGRLLSTESNKVDEPFKVQEAETVNMPPPPSEKLLVLGGNGFVGSHVCKEALEHGLSVASLSRASDVSIYCFKHSCSCYCFGNVLLELKFTLNAVGNQL